MQKDGQEQGKRHGQYGFIPAGILIGLGLGLLTGYTGSGVLIGLGLGFAATGLVPVITKQETTAGENGRSGTVMMIAVGIFLILIGAGITWAPALLWPYLIAGFLILLGIWFLVHGFRHGH